jgi:hypothetical protein
MKSVLDAHNSARYMAEAIDETKAIGLTGQENQEKFHLYRHPLESFLGHGTVSLGLFRPTQGTQEVDIQEIHNDGPFQVVLSLILRVTSKGGPRLLDGTLSRTAYKAQRSSSHALLSTEE